MIMVDLVTIFSFVFGVLVGGFMGWKFAKIQSWLSLKFSKKQ